MGAKINLRYHIVLVTKYRKKALAGIEDDVIQAFKDCERESAFKIEKIAVEDSDHVHVVLRTTATYSLASSIARMKAMTTHSLWDSQGSKLKKFYWGTTKKLWSGGYYAATVGAVSVEHVEKYLRKQGYWK